MFLMEQTKACCILRSPLRWDNATNEYGRQKLKDCVFWVFPKPPTVGGPTQRDRLLQQGSGADQAHVLRRPQVIQHFGYQRRRSKRCGGVFIWAQEEI